MKSTTLYRPLNEHETVFKNLFLENRHADLSLALRSSRWIVTSQDLGAWRRLESVHSERVKRIFRDPRWGRGAGVRWDLHGAALRPGRRDASALSVPARSPIPAAAHTRAPRVHAPPRAPTRPRSRPPGCPHPAGVPEAGRESVPWSSTGAGGGGEGGSPIVGGWGVRKAGNSRR